MLGSILGSVISAGAGLLGASMAPKPTPGKDFKKVFNAKMAMGQKYGISKLVMAGTPSPLVQPQDNSIGNAIADMGASVGRAVQANMSEPERAIARATLDKIGSENELLKAQARNINLRTIREATPPMPVPTLMKERLEPPARTTHVNVGGYSLPMNPGWSDAATIENRYGETVSDWLYGPSVLAADSWYNAPVQWSTQGAGPGGSRSSRGGYPYRTGGGF